MKLISFLLKVNILNFFFLIFFLTASCKKVTCECTAYNVNNPEPGGTGSFTVKKNSTSECTDKSTSPDANGNYTSCVIK